MSRESMRALLEKHGSFPEAAEVRANFEALFQLGEGGQERTEDLAWGFAQALDQWSQVDAVVDGAVAARLRRWVFDRWPAESTGSAGSATRLGRLLINVPSPETRSFLAERRAQATEHDLQRALDELLADHPG